MKNVHKNKFKTVFVYFNKIYALEGLYNIIEKKICNDFFKFMLQGFVDK